MDPLTSNNHCGATTDCQGSNAGAVCGLGHKCDGAGLCALTCQQGLVECFGSCVDPASNPTFCGAGPSCTGYTTCPGTHACVNGTCKELVGGTGGCLANTKKWLVMPTTSTSPSGELPAWGVAAHQGDEITVVGTLGYSATFLGGTPSEFSLSAANIGEPLVMRLDGNGTILWAVLADNIGARAIDVTALSDGSALVLGAYEGTITFNPGTPNAFTLTSAGGWDVYVGRVDPAGVFTWAKSAGGTDDDYAYRIHAHSDGSFAITGTYELTLVLGPTEPGQIQLASNNTRQAFLARYHASGEVDWAVSMGGPSNFDELLGLRRLADGSIAVSGRYRGTATVDGLNGTGTTVNGPPNDPTALVARYYANGELAWVRTAQRISSGLDVAEAPNGSIVLYVSANSGVVFGAGEPGQTSMPSSGMALAHHAANGMLSSLQYLGLASEAQHMVIAPDGSAVHVGYHIGTASFVDEAGPDTQLVSAGQTDAFFACADTAGQTYWARGGGSVGHDRAQGVALLPGGDLVVAGTFRDSATFDPGTPDVQTLVENGSGNVFVARYEP